MDTPLKDSDCIICFEPLELGDIATLNCKHRHKFHSKCIGEWFLSKNNNERICPLCVTENVEVLTITPSKYGNSCDYLFISDSHRRKPDTPRPTYSRLRNEYELRERRNSVEVDECCMPCIII